MVEIIDCRKKEKLVTRKIGGDYELKFIDIERGTTLYTIWLKMKTPWMKTSKRLDDLFEVMKTYLENQDET